jgi:hypothetical protein
MALFIFGFLLGYVLLPHMLTSILLFTYYEDEVTIDLRRFKHVLMKVVLVALREHR